MAKKKKIEVQGTEISIYKGDQEDYISLTDIARHKNPNQTDDVIKNWMRNRNTIELLGFWEKLYNPDFKPVEFDGFRKEAGDNYFSISPQKWIREVNAIGIVSTSGRYGGTYAHKDIAFEFASWISPEFKLYLIVEYQRLKEKESKSLEWSVSRELSKINYKVHTDAISKYIVPNLSDRQIHFVYANEADMLNVALFGMTAKEWRNINKEKEGNIRDFATLEQLICLANLESINSVLVKEGDDQSTRLVKLNEIAKSQMKILLDNKNVKLINKT